MTFCCLCAFYFVLFCFETGCHNLGFAIKPRLALFIQWLLCCIYTYILHYCIYYPGENRIFLDVLFGGGSWDKILLGSTNPPQIYNSQASSLSLPRMVWLPPNMCQHTLSPHPLVKQSLYFIKSCVVFQTHIRHHQGHHYMGKEIQHSCPDIILYRC